VIKLYRGVDGAMEYWETWKHGGVHTVHWGRVGERGSSREERRTFFRSAARLVAPQIAAKKAEGFREIADEDHHVVLVEYAINGMGTPEDLEKRHRLQARLNETLGWTGLGHCDGGSIGSGTMEVCCLVVNFAIAARIIEADLRGSEFSDFTRIFREDE
jgi:hypothetical protein